MTGRPERIMLWCKQQRQQKPQNFSAHQRSRFPVPIRRMFFSMQTFEADKTSNASGDANHGCITSEETKFCVEKSKDKILNSSSVSIFFNESLLASSPNKILAIELSESNLQLPMNQ